MKNYNRKNYQSQKKRGKIDSSQINNRFFRVQQKDKKSP